MSPGNRTKDHGGVGLKPHGEGRGKLYSIYMRFLLLLLSFPLLASNTYSQTDALADLLRAPGAAVADFAVPLSGPAAVETYPDYEQDRKPAAQVSNTGGVRLLSGVRFERDAEKNIYRWGELKLEDAALEEVYFGFRSASVGHNFLLFTFRDGAKLVVEVLPWKKKGEKFDPIVAGTTGKYDLVWNLVSFDSFLETAVGSQGLYVDVYPMKLSREEKLRMLDAAIAEATRDYRGEKYHTLLNSCSSNALKVFTKGTGHHLLIARMLPSVVIKHLKLRGFLGAAQHYDTTNWNKL